MSEWGSNPASFAALGTVTAAIFGVLGFLIAVRQYGLAVDSQRQLAAKAMRRQAELVTVEIVRDSQAIPVYSGIPLDLASSAHLALSSVTEHGAVDAARTFVVQLVNRSETPVQLIGLVSYEPHFINAHSASVYKEVKWFIPTRYYLERFWNGSFPPGSRFLSIPLRKNFAFSEDIGVLFRDSSGTLWTRTLRGQLLWGTLGTYSRFIERSTEQ